MPLKAQPGLDGHVDWVHEHRDRQRGPIIEAGPFHDPRKTVRDELVGLALLDLDSLAAARTFVETDPVVATGAFAFKLYEWGGAPLRR